MLQQNTNTSAGLVNGMRGAAEEVILDTGVDGIPVVTCLVCLIADMVDSIVDRTR